MRKKKLTAEVIRDTKQALDLMLADVPDGQVVNLRKLPEPFRSVLDHGQAVGMTFGRKAAVRVKDAAGHYTDEMIIFSMAVRRNSKRRARRTSRRMAAKRRRTSRR